METDRYHSIRSERNHVFGLKLLVGYNKQIQIFDKITTVFKLYTGLSTRYKIYTYENVNNILEDGTIIPYGSEEGTAYWPLAIQLGVKIGLSRLIINND